MIDSIRFSRLNAAHFQKITNMLRTSLPQIYLGNTDRMQNILSVGDSIQSTILGGFSAAERKNEFLGKELSQGARN